MAWARRGDGPDRLISLCVGLKSRSSVSQSCIHTLNWGPWLLFQINQVNFFCPIDLGARREGLLHLTRESRWQKMTKSDKRHILILRSEMVSQFRLKSEKVGPAPLLSAHAANYPLGVFLPKARGPEKNAAYFGFKANWLGWLRCWRRCVTNARVAQAL